MAMHASVAAELWLKEMKRPILASKDRTRCNVGIISIGFLQVCTQTQGEGLLCGTCSRDI